MRRFAREAAGRRCLGCGVDDDLRVAHLNDQLGTRATLEGEGWRPEIFPRTYDWMYATAFHNIGNIAQLCAHCEERREIDELYKKRIDDAWHRAMRRAARSGLLLEYLCTGLARVYDSPYAAELHGPGTKVSGPSQEDLFCCLSFLQEAATAGEAPSQIVVVPLGGTPEERARRFHYHLDLMRAVVGACEGDHHNCVTAEVT